MEESSKKPVICILDSSRHTTGAFKSISEIAFQLQNEFEFVFFIPKSSQNSTWLEKNSFKYYKIPIIDISLSWNLIWYLPVLLYGSLKVLKISRKLNSDIIHVNDIINISGVLIKMLRPSVRLIYHIRLLENSYFARLYSTFRRLITKYADHIVCVSNAVRKSFSKSPQALTIYNPLAKHQAGNSLQTTDEVFNMLYLANYTAGKGHEYAIKAFAKASSALDQSVLRIVGGDLGNPKNEIYKKELIRLSEELKIKDKIEFLDRSDNVEKEYAWASVFLNFSESESFSRTCVEAMQEGVPVIASRCGGPEELIVNEKTGLLVENRDIDDMANAILALYKDPKFRKDLGVAGMKEISALLSPENTILKMKGVYASCIA